MAVATPYAGWPTGSSRSVAAVTCCLTSPSTPSRTRSPCSAPKPRQWTSTRPRGSSPARWKKRASPAPAGRGRLAQALQHHCHALAAADAHRLETERLVVVLQRVDECRGDPRAGHAERVTDGDRAAVDVELVAERVDADAARRRDDLGGECLVDLDQVDVVDGLAGVGEGLLGRLDRPEAHDLRREGGHARRQDAGERRQTERLRLVLTHDDDRSSAVVERAAVAGRDRAIRAEHRLELADTFDGHACARPVILGDLGAVRLADRDDLALPEAVGDGLLSEVLRPHAERVLLLAPDGLLRRDVLRGLAHRDVDVGDVAALTRVGPGRRAALAELRRVRLAVREHRV